MKNYTGKKTLSDEPVQFSSVSQLRLTVMLSDPKTSAL